MEASTKLFGATQMLYPNTLIHSVILKWASDADLDPNEAEVAKQYPAHTAICIRDGWEFCSPELAAGMILLEKKECLLTFSFYPQDAKIDPAILLFENCVFGSSHLWHK
jgi:hypothetical protein